MVGLASYGSGAKQTWRGWQWNRIAEKIPRVKRKYCVCVYLVGPRDEDRICALKHGFSNRNIIAVDSDADNVAMVRRAGGVAICGNLADVVAMWPSDDPIQVIVADFTSGLTRGAVSLQAALWNSYALSCSTIISINLLRGRDAFSNEIRVDAAGYLKQQKGEFVRFAGDKSLADHDKHRALHWKTQMLLSYANQMTTTEPQRRQVFYDLFCRCQTDYASYKSHVGEGATLVFDSAIMRWPFVEHEKHVKRASRDQIQPYANCREAIYEGGQKVRFDYQSYVAKFACLKTAREKASA